MISILTQQGYTVIRTAPSNDPDVQDGIRIVGLYESKEEAEFIARKALKMEKTSVYQAALERNPEMRKTRPQDVVINASYNVVYTPVHEGNHDAYSPRYSNGQSCVSIYIQEQKEARTVDRMIKNETKEGLSFREWVMTNERRF